MSTFSDIRAIYGLVGTAAPSNGAVSGSVQVGQSQTQTRLTSATKIHAFEAVIAGASSDLVIDISDLDSTGSTAWTAGAAQVETATAAGTITGSGNATVTVTAAGMTGSPKAISVAVENGDTAADWAEKVRAALAADADVSAIFTVGGTSTAMVLTRKPTKTYTVKGSTVNLYAANDATLNIALDNGTCTGITTASTSANTTTGVLTAGTYAPDLDGNDVFGDATNGLGDVYGWLVECDSTSESYVQISQSTVLSAYLVSVGGAMSCIDLNDLTGAADFTIEPDSSAKIKFTIAGA